MPPREYRSRTSLVATTHRVKQQPIGSASLSHNGRELWGVEFLHGRQKPSEWGLSQASV